MDDINSINSDSVHSSPLFSDFLDGLRRRCCKCKQFKPLTDYSKKKRRPFGVGYICHACAAALARERKAKDPEGSFAAYRHNLLKTTYNLTPEEYQAMLASQGGVCAICKNAETHRQSRTKRVKLLAVDHDHTTGKVRALLCRGCNLGIAAFKDNPELLRSAIAYLVSHGRRLDSE